MSVAAPPRTTLSHPIGAAPSRPRLPPALGGGLLARAFALSITLTFALPLALTGAGTAMAADRALSWASLTAAQQQALDPLKPYWATIDAGGRQKWLALAARFPAMSADEQLRARQYMASWAALTPAERGRARAQFQEARRLSPEERQARWEAYRALPEEERQRLGQQATRSAARRTGPSSTAAAAPATAQADVPSAARPGTEPLAPPAGKSNVVTPTVAPRPRAVAPTVVQARPGVSTTSVATSANPPAHHQAGLPKIVATPGFVDPATLLPRRGPQGAAVTVAPSDDAPKSR
jgi:Protein of unknown function (DUF3106)